MSHSTPDRDRDMPRENGAGCAAHALAHDPHCPSCGFRAGQEAEQQRALTTIETFIEAWAHTNQSGADRVRQVLDGLHHLLSEQPWLSLHEQAQRLMDAREVEQQQEYSQEGSIAAMDENNSVQGQALKPQQDHAHFGCPTCGDVFMLPWDEHDRHLPWCTHGGAARYQWPSAVDWKRVRERWIEAGRTELQMIRVTLAPAPSSSVPAEHAAHTSSGKVDG